MLKMIALSIIAAIVLSLSGCFAKEPEKGSAGSSAPAENQSQTEAGTQSVISADSLITLGELNGEEVIDYDPEGEQIYRVNTSTGEMTPLVGETAFDRSRREYVDAMTGEMTELRWCANPVLNGSEDAVGTPIIAYYSNKYYDADKQSCADSGAIWLIDINSGTETRLDPPEGYTVNGGFIPVWDANTVAFSVSNQNGEEYYASYDVDTENTFVADISESELAQLIGEDLEFWKFRAFGGFESSPGDVITLEDEYGEKKEYAPVSDARFNTPEGLSAYLGKIYYDENYINSLGGRFVEHDGRIYHELGLKEYPFSKDFSVKLKKVVDGWDYDQATQEENNEYGQYKNIMLVASVSDKEDADFVAKMYYSFVRTSDGWKILWSDGNMSVADGWKNTDFPEVIGISEKQTSELLKKEAFIFENTYLGCFRYSEPGVPFDMSNGIEKDGWMYYKITDPDFDTWDEWEALVREVYTGEAAEELLNAGYYIDVDGALYGSDSGVGFYYDRTNYCWHITDVADDWIELVKSYGGGGENEYVINRDIYGIVHTENGWRIESIEQTQEYVI